jgi:hypothetical protein
LIGDGDFLLWWWWTATGDGGGFGCRWWLGFCEKNKGEGIRRRVRERGREGGKREVAEFFNRVGIDGNRRRGLRLRLWNSLGLAASIGERWKGERRGSTGYL